MMVAKRYTRRGMLVAGTIVEVDGTPVSLRRLPSKATIQEDTTRKRAGFATTQHGHAAQENQIMLVSRILAYHPQHRHYPLPEGVRVGLITATAIWLWIALVDAAFGQPFHTFDALGGIAVFTVVHYLLNIVCWVAIVAVVRDAERTPSATFAVLFGVVILEVAIAMVTNLLAETAVGPTAWVGLLGGSLIATGIGMVIMARTHPFAKYLHIAEEET